jgi:nitrite reductase (NADH) small subunit
MTKLASLQGWADICAASDIAPETGVCALVAGRQIALVRTVSGELYALDNFDPFARAFVISRGIVGDRAGRPKIASPMYKQSFDLETGRCLDDASVTLETFPVRERGGRVEVLVRACAEAAA